MAQPADCAHVQGNLTTTKILQKESGTMSVMKSLTVPSAPIDIPIAHENELPHPEAGHFGRGQVAALWQDVVPEGHLGVHEHLPDLLVQRHATCGNMQRQLSWMLRET